MIFPAIALNDWSKKTGENCGSSCRQSGSLNHCSMKCPVHPKFSCTEAPRSMPRAMRKCEMGPVRASGTVVTSNWLALGMWSLVGLLLLPSGTWGDQSMGKGLICHRVLWTVLGLRGRYRVGMGGLCVCEQCEELPSRDVLMVKNHLQLWVSMRVCLSHKTKRERFLLADITKYHKLGVW